ncbi:hypothetical protein MMC18_007686 [Xylographa bjoerkii]|nr:hypothetical protein [Xylographa bjoerkii]
MSSALASLSPAELNALADYPALTPPPGVVPNFVNPENQNTPEFVVTSLLLAVMILFFINRIYVKSILMRKCSWDDLTCMLAVLGSVAYYVSCIWGAQYGKLGVHEWNVSIPEAANPNLLIPAYLITVLTPPTFLFLKLTFFIMYLSIFGRWRWLRINAYIGAGFTIVFSGALTIMQFVCATPSAGETWLSHQVSQNEQYALAVSVPQSAVGLAIDIYILVLPIVAVSKLQLTTRRKIGIMAIFMTGFLACLSSMLSIYYRNILTHSPDVTWVLMPVNTVTLTEMFVGVICACMPSAAHSFRHHFPSFDVFVSRFYTRFSGYKSSMKSGPPSKGYSHHSSSTYGTRSSDRKPLHAHAAYMDIESKATDTYTAWSEPKTGDSRAVGHPERGRTAGVRTVIKSGRPEPLVKDGIRVDYEMQMLSRPGVV